MEWHILKEAHEIRAEGNNRGEVGEVYGYYRDSLVWARNWQINRNPKTATTGETENRVQKKQVWLLYDRVGRL
ncbi:MAG: hypothetical protein F6K56_44000 [Moorea sp. SIO3G5]|nr:hypothetical protein [Moorena sp. SIO3G5]